MMGSPGASAPGLVGGGRVSCRRGRPPRLVFPPILSGFARPDPGSPPRRHRLARDDDAAPCCALLNRQNPALLSSHPHASEQWGAGTVYLDYDLSVHRTTVTDRRGNVRIYEHDAAGHVVREVDPAGSTTTIAYDEEGLLESRTEPLGRVATYAYQTAGDRRSRANVTSMTVTPDGRGANGSAASLATTMFYDGRTNQASRIVDSRGAVTALGLTPGGLPQVVTQAEGAPEESTTRMSYNDHGQPVDLTDPNGHVTHYDYFENGDSKGYLRQVIVDPGGLNLTTRYETDARGNVTAVIDPRGVRHERVVNELDWLVEEHAATTAATPVGGLPSAPALDYVTTYLYDANGNLIERRDPVGDGVTQESTTSTYGPLDELLTVAQHAVPGGQLIQTQYEYDANLNLIRTTDPEGKVTETTYDERNQAVTVARGDTLVTETYAYDADGAQTTTTDGRGYPWTTIYDGYGRVRETADPLGNLARTTYDDGGNPVETQRLDAEGELLAKAGTAYDLVGRVRTRTDWLWRAVTLRAAAP